MKKPTLHALGHSSLDPSQNISRFQGIMAPQSHDPGGGGTSLWVRRGCAPVLGSFWPENSGIGVSSYWKISVIGVYFHSEFSGIGDYSKFCNGC